MRLVRELTTQQPRSLCEQPDRGQEAQGVEGQHSDGKAPGAWEQACVRVLCGWVCGGRDDVGTASGRVGQARPAEQLHML